jgi:hypothetical protein
MLNIQNYSNFDWESYIKKYTDLQVASCMNSKKDAWRHWVLHGKKENRQYFSTQVKQKCISKEFFEDNYTVYISRHINDSTTSMYWRHNYHFLRKTYKNIKIVVIDDNSNKEYMNYDCRFDDVTFIYSADEKADQELNCENFKQRGELLPFYFYYKYGTTKYAMFIHDSVFIHKPIHDDIYEDDFIALWSFNSFSWYHKLNNDVTNIISKLNKSKELLMIWKEATLWEGTFGGMCIVSLQYIRDANEIFDFLSIGMNNIINRTHRMGFERLLSIIYFYRHKRSPNVIYGDIHSWSMSTFGKMWGLNWNEYLSNAKKFVESPIIKVWTGR